MQPFDHPDIIKLFGVLLDNLLIESGRGALLIATSHVDEQLTYLLEAVLPKKISKAHKERLFKYPGALSSFSAKIDLAYAFRLIDKNLYDSLNALRKLRNDAAHSPNKFELHELNEKMKGIYNLGPGIINYIQESSMKLLLQDKIAMVEKHLENFNFSDEEKERKLKEVFKNKEKIEILEKQVPFWELVVGLCLLCWLIIHNKESVYKITLDISTWSDLLKEIPETT